MTFSTITMKAQNPAHIVSVPPRFAAEHLHAAIKQIDGTQEEVHLLAGSVRFADPLDICALRSLIDHAAENALQVRLECPGDSNVHCYLERVNVYDDLPPNVILSTRRPPIQRRALSEKLIELTRVRTSDDAEALMDKVNAIASGQFGRGTLATAFATAIGATAENAVMHSRSPTGALVAAQRYKGTGLELAVVDRGLGIPQTLTQNPRHRGLSDLEAVERSLEDGVSSSPNDGRGAGLWELEAAVAASRDATLAIASGQADLSLSWRGGVRTCNRTTPAEPISGTWISIRLEGGKEH
jgi:anti-sigma regulatory factor (Ser/Thr protein kinase)